MSNYHLADTKTQWFQDNPALAGADMHLTPKTAVLCMHTTESFDWPTYSGGAVAPTYTAKPDIAAKRLRFRAHFPDEKSARALQNLLGGTETNTLNVVQLELVGSCDAAHRFEWNGKKAGVDYIYWPAAPDWALAQVADFIVDQHTRHGLQLVAPKLWLNYGPDPRRPGVTPASFGASPARMTVAQWRNFAGVCGHQHVPENVHGDPGAFPIDKVLKMAKAKIKPPVKGPRRRKPWLANRAKRGLEVPLPLGSIAVNCMSGSGVSEKRSLAILKTASEVVEKGVPVDEIFADELGNVTTDTPLDPNIWDYVHDPSDPARAGSLHAVRHTRGRETADITWHRGCPGGFGIRARWIPRVRTVYDPGTVHAWQAVNAPLHGPPMRAWIRTAMFMAVCRLIGADKYAGDWNRLSAFVEKALPGTRSRFVGILGHSVRSWIPVSAPTPVDVGGDHEAVFVTYWPTTKENR